MQYSGVYVFGDSLVDAGNALKLAELYGDLTFSDLPEGAPTASDWAISRAASPTAIRSPTCSPTRRSASSPSRSSLISSKTPG